MQKYSGYTHDLLRVVKGMGAQQHKSTGCLEEAFGQEPIPLPTI